MPGQRRARLNSASVSDARAGSSVSPRLEVVIDASPLRDGRRRAGIGRYVSAMLAALSEQEGLRVRAVTPPLPPPHDSWAVRWLNAQPPLAVARARGLGRLLHGMASEVSLAWPAKRQVVTVHDVVPWGIPGLNPMTRRFLATQAHLIRRCAAIIAVSDSVAVEATRVLDLDPGLVHVVPEGVDPLFSPAPRDGDDDAIRRAGIPAGDYVLWVGSMRNHDPRKGLDVLLDAASRMPPLTLVLAGATGEESRRLQGRAEDLGLHLAVPGFVADVDLAALYRGAAAAVLPSRYEGFGLPVLEAMASGVPVVATRAGNLVDLAGDAGVLVPADDPAALAGALSQLLNDPAERQRLAAAGPALAARYTWLKAAQRTAEVYRLALEAVSSR
jgi:glycosyltransferase involved in cell wall biosynthesis